MVARTAAQFAIHHMEDDTQVSHTGSGPIEIDGYCLRVINIGYCPEISGFNPIFKSKLIVLGERSQSNN